MSEQIKINEMDNICPGKVRKLKLLNKYFCGVGLTENEKKSWHGLQNGKRVR